LQIEQVRVLMKAGTLSQTVAQAAITQAQDEIHAMERVQPEKDEKHTARVIRMLPRAAEVFATAFAEAMLDCAIRARSSRRATLYSRCSAAGAATAGSLEGGN